MARRYSKRLTGGRTLACATWLLALGTPALASSSVSPSCENTINALLETSAEELHAAEVSHDIDQTSQVTPSSRDGEDDLTTAPHLSPEAESVLRQVSEEHTEAAAESSEEQTATDSGNPPTIKARVPGVSEGDLERYKRHMLRRDI